MKKEALWRSEMKDADHRELELAKNVHDAASIQYREVAKRVKARCIKRLHRKGKAVDKENK